jgi:hypothetical protein
MDISYRKQEIKDQLVRIAEQKLDINFHVYSKNILISSIEVCKLAIVPKGNRFDYVVFIQRGNDDIDSVQFYFDFENISSITSVINAKYIVIDISI